MGASTSSILDATNSGDLEQLKQTLASLKESNTNLTDYLNYTDDEGRTPLHIAAIKGNSQSVKLLLENGALTDLVDDQGNRPLDSAVFIGNKETAQALIEGGASINAYNKDGMTPLHWAVAESKFDCIELLIQKDANLEIKNNKNQSPLDMKNNMKTKQRNKMEAFLNDVLQKYKKTVPLSPKVEGKKETQQETTPKTTQNSSPAPEQVNKPAAVVAQVSKPDPERDQARIRRLVGLCKLWGLVKYIHPYLIDKKLDWDNALITTLQKFHSSLSTDQYKRTINQMLEILGDPNTRCLDTDDLKQQNTRGLDNTPASATEQQQPYVKFTEDKIAIVVATHHERFQDYGVMIHFLNSFKEAQTRGQAVVFDFRLKKGNSINFAAHPFKFMVYEAIKTLLDRQVSLPAYRQRIYSGYPQQRNFSNVFHSGLMIVEGEQLQPSHSGTERVATKPWVFLINKFTPDCIVDLISGLRCADLAKVVFEKQEGDIDVELGVSVYNLPMGEDLIVNVRKNQRLNADNSLGFVPNMIVNASNEAQGTAVVDIPLHTAIKLAAGVETAHPLDVPKAGVYAPRSVDDDYSHFQLPSQEFRLLALFRFWNIIQYFFPYRDLMDKNWEQVLVEFIPKLERVTTPLEYHLCISELVAACCDSHATCTSTVLNSHLGTHFPPIEVRLIEGRTIISHLFIDAHGNKPANLNLGDEILTIDGENVNVRKSKLASILSASTPQALQWKVHQKLLCGDKDSRLRLEVRDKNGQTLNVPLVRLLNLSTAKKVQERPSFCTLQNGLIGYINTVTLHPGEVEKSLEAIKNTKCLILDIRGYPKGIIYQIAPRFIRQKVTVAVTQTPLFLPDLLYAELDSCLIEEKHHLHPSTQWKYSGKIIVLINEETISHAEHSCLYLERCTEVTFVGTTSNGANGNVSNCHLPGGILIAFTGLGAMHGDKTQLQRKGITPDILVHPTIEGIRHGKDEIFDKAVEYATAIYGSNRGAPSSNPPLPSSQQASQPKVNSINVNLQSN